ncbi:GSCFA domain-containing protein [Rhodonellum sp.]|uniref:GSCFA domain-containing protein n=1 Tax=Rhodonellum sp. TaxID=2231180 RepID=UPI00271C8784|nr:GSCFA domain-containing protein [Rhodonellum sp.]MDO9554304.1 GSCFA domain-containing protein [Rhodonellum sp.]
MQWTTAFEIPSFEPKINHDAVLYSIGSCFSSTIGEKLQDRKFNMVNNPFGTLFNPVSICQAMEDSILEMPVNTDLILIRDGLYLHFGMHSDVVAYSKESLDRLIQKKQHLSKVQLEKATHILITFGTAWVYEYGNSDQIVANCHKQPAGLFEKRLLKTEEITKAFASFLSILQQFNPKAKIILTVSPVRHTKDGIPENQLSKSILRLACHEIVTEFPNAHYFPSYEIMMDELRDYRFYKEDLVHPTEQAEEYIWEKFMMAWIDPKSFPIIKEVESIKKDLAHRPFNVESPAHLKFLENLHKKLERMSHDFDFSKEIDQLRKQVQYRGK